MLAIDGAQAVGHVPVDLGTLDVDFYFFSVKVVCRSHGDWSTTDPLDNQEDLRVGSPVFQWQEVCTNASILARRT